MIDRVEVLRRGIDPGTDAIEIGPLDRPVLAKPEFAVRYLDFADTQTLRDKYAQDPHVGTVAEVDVLWNGSGPLAEALPGASIDAVVASHVIEHVPDPVGWLMEFASVLRPGGVVSLAVPDKRFTFDYNRRLTEISDLVDAHMRRATVPSYAQMYDFHTKAIDADVALLWAGAVDYTGTVRAENLHREAFDGCVNQRDTGGYTDVHCHTFTPTSFIDLAEQLAEFELLDYVIAELTPTQHNTVEFFVRLERLDPALSGQERRELQHQGIRRARAAVDAGPAPASPAPASPPPGSDSAPAPTGAASPRISDLEWRAVRVKRRGMLALRRAGHAVRNRG
jgi:SAM-dependent methyltransferase